METVLIILVLILGLAFAGLTWFIGWIFKPNKAK